MAKTDKCCKGLCKRSNKPPPMIMRGGLTGEWYVVLDYTDLGGGSYEAKDKHRLHPDSVKQLNSLLKA